ncbi:hypothetical protein [Kitasatospora cinereorecta]|uniref:Uncharacterized protein n=1 Tax=Kitasatospora cinereorecta TaxID=285560 RepID=A0ABW0VBB6_9ACTN
MNLDFSVEPLFSWYVVLLLISGVAMVGIGAVASSGLSAGWRVFNVIAGVGFVGYGIYLGFIFEGGTYIIFLKAFILPVLMIVNFVRSLANRKNAAPVQASMVAPVPAPAPADAVPAPAAENQVH